MVKAIKDFFIGLPIPKFFTSTSIALIAKIPNPERWSDFHPISLCMTFNKLISKILANRLARIFPIIIFINQTGFMKGRNIIDNVLLAQELVHYINVRIRGHNIIYKLNISKAYDNINWTFLVKILNLFGFDERFIRLITNCIDNNWFYIRLMEKLMASLNPHRV